MKPIERAERTFDWFMAGALGLAALTGVGGYFVGKQTVPEQQTEQVSMPGIMDNQALVLHPGFLRGYQPLSYTILTDTDKDGS